MSKDKQFFIVMLVIWFFVLVYDLYYLWFMPEEYTKKIMRSIKDWLPFADLYRKWYSSKYSLWVLRIAFTLFLLVIIAIFCLMAFDVDGFMPNLK